jgi:hypothetical protein
MKNVPLVLLGALFFIQSKSQTLGTLETNILARVKNIDRFDSVHNYESFAVANSQLLNFLYRNLPKYPASITAEFKRLKKSRLRILTSDDGMLRIYFWYVEGGSARTYNVSSSTWSAKKRKWKY